VVNSRLSFARNFILAEKSRFRSSQPRKAAKRCVQGVKNRIYKFVLLANESFNSLGMSEIYNYIDQNGIPFKRLASFSIRIQEDNILNKLQVESDKTAEQIIKKGSLIFSTPNQPNVKAPGFPNKLNLDKKEQEETLIKIRNKP
jgi:hypothetical protein